MSAADRVRALYADLERGSAGEALRHHFAPEARTIEHPNALKPRGARSELAAMLAGSEAGAGILASQRYAVRALLEQGEQVIVRLTWTGVMAKDVGPFRAEQVLTAHIAQFITVRQDQIVEIETFDCYEPFSG